jgi:ABC-type transport system substrate-binding protein
MEQLPPETAQWYKFDPARAKQLAAAAGAEGLNVTYLSPTPFPSTGEYSSFKEMREATFTMLQALPWKINLVLLDNAHEWGNNGKGVRYGNFAAGAAIWGGLEGFADIDDYVYSWYGSQSSLNIGRLKDETLDAMILKGRSIINEDERLKQYLDIQRYLAAQMYSVAGNPYGLSYTMVSQDVRNYLLSNLTEVVTGTFANLWLKR